MSVTGNFAKEIREVSEGPRGSGSVRIELKQLHRLQRIEISAREASNTATILAGVAPSMDALKILVPRSAWFKLRDNLGR